MCKISEVDISRPSISLAHSFFLQVSAIIGGYLLLGETFAPLNLAGTGVAVFVTFLYVGRQYIDRRNRLSAAKEGDVEEGSSPMASGDDGTANDEGPHEQLLKVRLEALTSF